MTIDSVIHQVLSGRVLGLIVGSIYCRQIAAYRNGEGMSSSTGKRFCTELVFEVIQEDADASSVHGLCDGCPGDPSRN